MKFVFLPSSGNPPGRLAEVELHFDAPLAGLKLTGFAIWQGRRGGRLNVTFPARSYAVNGERRTFALLRPVDDMLAAETLRHDILAAFAAYEEEQPPPRPVTSVESQHYIDTGKLPQRRDRGDQS